MIFELSLLLKIRNNYSKLRYLTSSFSVDSCQSANPDGDPSDLADLDGVASVSSDEDFGSTDNDVKLDDIASTDSSNILFDLLLF